MGTTTVRVGEGGLGFSVSPAMIGGIGVSLSSPPTMVGGIGVLSHTVVRLDLGLGGHRGHTTPARGRHSWLVLRHRGVCAGRGAPVLGVLL